MNGLLRYNRYNYCALVLAMLIWTFSASALSQVMKDPTMPLQNLDGAGFSSSLSSEQEEEVISFILQSVIVHNGKKIAVINNQMVQVGQQIAGYEVSQIVPYGAELFLPGSDGSETLSLTLLKANIKVTHE